MQLSEYVQYDGLGLAGLVAKGDVTSAELERLAHQAIDRVNGRLNAVIEHWPAAGGEARPVLSRACLS
jgi:amidase